ncbi:MAG: glycosyltransferase family 4 protein [Dehalococcoidia bacterium]|nr:glycosyltransferase family 4 protein [Dehalococcoidia bacterium]
MLGKSDHSGSPCPPHVHAAKGEKGGWPPGLMGGVPRSEHNRGLVAVPRPDVILCPSPPLTIESAHGSLASCAAVLSSTTSRRSIPISPSISEPRSRSLIWILRGLERWVCRRAAAITVIAPRMLENLRSKGVPPEKLFVIPNFVDTEDLHPGPKDNDFSRTLGISGKFVVTYAGNLGPAQGLTTVIEAAALLQTNPEIHVLMIGGGTSEKGLREMAGRLGLSNVTFLPYHPYSTMPQIYAASNLCLVPQALETGSDAVPSKVYRIMACARAVIAVTEPTSDLALLVLESGAASASGRVSP